MNVLKPNNKRLISIKATRSESGFLLAFFAIFIPVLIGFLGLVVDVSQVYGYSSRIKSAVDLGVIAGISQLSDYTAVSSAKNTALTYLNNNLTMTIPGFSAITISDSNLTIQGGAYDSTTSAWTFNESTSACNSLKVTYTYAPPSLLGSYFMINSYSYTGTSIAAKSYAGAAPAGTSFPIALDQAALTSALAASNMVRIYQNGASQNSYFADLSGSAMSSDAISIIDYFQNSSGTPSPALTLGTTFNQLNGSGQISMIYSDELIGWSPGSTIFILPVGANIGGNTVRVDGYVGATLDAFGVGGMSNYADITIYPSTATNNWGILQLGADPSNVTTANKALLASGVGLVQ